MYQVPRIVRVLVGQPKVVTTDSQNFAGPQREWTTGFEKLAVSGPVRLDLTNLEGDAQADLVHHGGRDKAICVYSEVHYSYWRQLPELSKLDCGGFGENLTVANLTEHDVCIGDIWIIGTATVQVSQPRQPCWKLARWWNVKDLSVQVQRTGFTGWYFRVLERGELAEGDQMTLQYRKYPEWTISAANDCMHHDKEDLARASRLAAIDTLSESWRTTLTNRVSKHQEPPVSKRLTDPA